MRAPTATELAPQLEAIGLDPKNLPPLTKLAPEQLRKVMPLIAKSLGAKCSDCHNFASDGPQQRTARMNAGEQMWNHFVRGLTTVEGEPLFCDSCHHGSFVVLDRTDPHAVEAWMKENFVGKLTRVDQKEHGCETCHGTPMRMRFIDSWKTR